MSRHNGKSNATRPYRRQLRLAIARNLPHCGLPLLPGDDRQRWTPRYLAVQSILMACLGKDRLIDRFHDARIALVDMYSTRRRPGESYQGFVAALEKTGSAALDVIVKHLRKRVRAVAGDDWLVEGYAVFGCDGSRFDKTRTTANKESFGQGGKDKSPPQQLLTTLFHVGTGLPWCWRAGNADASERHQLLDMLDLLPPEALLLLDAGYTGYDMLQQIKQSGRSFIVRVGASVELLTGLGWNYRESKGTVYLWPAHVQDRKLPPLVLRLVVETDANGKQMHLLTSVLDRKELSDRALRRLYRLRWENEILFRQVKQTMNQGKALSWTPTAARQELEWSMIGVWLLGLMALGAQRRVRKKRALADEPRERWSTAKTLRLIRRAIVGTMGRGRGLAELLSEAVRDDSQRRGSRRSHDWPHKKKEKPPGNPRVRKATKLEIRTAAVLKKVA